MITKGEIVETAIRKLFGDRYSTATGIESGSIRNALDDLEAMMATWQASGYDLFYNFREDTGVTPLETEDSFLELWMKLPVATNLAILISSDFGVTPSAALQSEASSSWHTLCRRYSKTPRVRPSAQLPVGQGSLRDGAVYSTPDKGFKQ